MTIEKLDASTPDLTRQNIERLLELFPECRTEGSREDAPSVDFDLLRQALSDYLVEGPAERYRLDWPGKRQALLTANTPINKTLRPMREESVDFDTTRNLFIEGDNLDALKLLQETYLGKVKMIYIDPPYNTGKDFIYKDNFRQAGKEFESQTGLNTDEGRLVANPDTSGRYHSNWLNMLYPRMKLARGLMRPDGVIAVSIDDVELNNLRKMMDEVFGHDQFLAQIIWKKRNTPPNDKKIGAQHDYILLYCRENSEGVNLRPRSQKQIDRYKNPDNHPKGPWVAGDLTSNVKGGRYVESLNYPIENPRTGKAFYPPNRGNWRFNKDKVARLIENDEIYFGADDQSSPKLKRFLADIKEGITWTTLWDFAPMNTQGSTEMSELFGTSTVFENPKPTGLLEQLLTLGASGQDIVLDFFAGSGSTYHAIQAFNANNGYAVRSISVQIPDEIEEDAVAFREGFRRISELSRERMKRAGKKLIEKKPELKGKLDIGFRAFRIDRGNFIDTSVTPKEATQEALLGMVSHIKDDRSEEDLLFGALLRWGVDITLPIEQRELAGRTVWLVDAPEDGSGKGAALIACFAKPGSSGKGGIDTELADAMAELAPLRVLFRDDGFADDATKENVHSRFQQRAPDTQVRVL